MDDIEERIDALVGNFKAVGMTWQDVQVAASLLHAKKIQEILISTFAGCSINELRCIAGHAHARLNPPEPAAAVVVSRTDQFITPVAADPVALRAFAASKPAPKKRKR